MKYEGVHTEFDLCSFFNEHYKTTSRVLDIESTAINYLLTYLPTSLTLREVCLESGKS